ncbi:ribonucleoside-triphosphate reductase [Monocercomonoides exilis]|uniref:ribonucleoside-triphosphate reductase n=1 Tax=Monocercomonoides exilis TaxID=2049356 RepID=UPI00355A58B5|nr:ribonucleoside-triphosphate reductase [Monocercomonoides exilis]|eukprot:MONOS_3212.1-p1 / transcript=MONOS_3212.1 / gene=MONOS_3212 / organism=Monocercomonoides_exilis_PA203 / gene_product=ribonucleoside-triphosphate reductase [EC:1.17.4.2] / transcript_product=ribonucleoside-triphosphate reductase [EC:1.17.4.2] / location=Mono_scaffold00073:117439-119834(+) / protein_length=778 / sequence_SO=supercontig / SO=protein_coding / is_pseudo=false
MESTITTDNTKVATDCSRIMSEIVFYRTYAQTIDPGRKETFEETVQRVENMHISKFPEHFYEIHQVMKFVRDRKVVPSMRSMQYAGRAIEITNARMYNCSFTNIECFRDFADILYLLCCGVGCGFSVQRRHISKLPVISSGTEETFLIPDSKEGWAESVFHLLLNPQIKFDYSLIRPRGASLSTGGTASGPETLEFMHEEVRKILKNATGRNLHSLEVHDILCLIADLIVSGGCRRSAMISLFDVDDEEMMNCKSGWEWFNTHPHRARANNSAVLLRTSPSFLDNLQMCVKKCFENGTGEPGIFLTNDPDYGTNPCAEISLRSKQMCNLTEVNVAACQSKEDFLSAVEAATVIGTIQATYTNFPFVQKEWSENCQKDSLLGVSLTGLAQNWEMISADGGATLEEAATRAKAINEEWARKLGINPASRIGCVKPSGTTSALLGTTSGIHAAHAPYYLRRVRMETDSPLTGKLLWMLLKQKKMLGLLGSDESEADDPFSNAIITKSNSIDVTRNSLAKLSWMTDSCESLIGLPLIETDVYGREKCVEKPEENASNETEEASEPAKPAKPTSRTIVVTFPMNMSSAIQRAEESGVELLERAAFIHKHFIQKSHRDGPNFHNVSLTVNYKPTSKKQVSKKEEDGTETKKEVTVEGEEDSILKWLISHTDSYAGISMFPDMSYGADVEVKYPQLPFEEVPKETFDEWVEAWKKLGGVCLQKEEEVEKEKLKGESTEKRKERVIEEDPVKVVCSLLADSEWNINAIDKRKEILACAGGNCEYT